MPSNKKTQAILVTIFCSLLMIITGASDALRGVFLPQFKSHFSLNDTQTSMIITLSYIGNLLFLSIGGFVIDRVSKKKFIMTVLAMWLGALMIYVTTSSYALLLIFIMFSMGASTMLSTSINLITPLLFISPAFYVNIFNFMQGIGISAAQNSSGRIADKFDSWHTVNLVLLILGAICFVLLIFIKLPAPVKADVEKSKGGYGQVLKNPACKYLILICGFYFIAEHSMQNWLISYSNEHFGLSISRSAVYLSLFFGGITVGRLLFAPFVQKNGLIKSLTLFISIATALYAVGFFTGKTGLILLCISGLACSIIWPTLALLISNYYPASQSGIAMGLIISIATFFDIGFNAFFGKAIDSFGYGVSMKIIPLAMVLFAVSFFRLKYRVKLSDTKKSI